MYIQLFGQKLKLPPVIYLDILVFALSINICLAYRVEPQDWFVTRESIIFLGFSLSTFGFGLLTINKIKKFQDTHT
jgi:protein-S-isoprenylcysteine O-methyltransferase Ste14